MKQYKGLKPYNGLKRIIEMSKIIAVLILAFSGIAVGGYLSVDEGGAAMLTCIGGIIAALSWVAMAYLSEVLIDIAQTSFITASNSHGQNSKPATKRQKGKSLGLERIRE